MTSVWKRPSESILPAEHRLLDQDLADRRGLEPAADHGLVLVAVVGDAAAGPGQREGRPDDRRQPEARISWSADLTALAISRSRPSALPSTSQLMAKSSAGSTEPSLGAGLPR